MQGIEHVSIPFFMMPYLRTYCINAKNAKNPEQTPFFSIFGAVKLKKESYEKIITFNDGSWFCI